MNQRGIERIASWQPLLAAIAVLTMTGMAHAVDIVASVSPTGPLGVGDEMTVHLAVTGWDAAVDGEVDAIDFVVDFDTSIFAYVSGSGVPLADGSEFLAQMNQQSDYTLFDDTNDLTVSFGRWGFGAFDDGFDSFAGGSAAVSGPLGSFRLKALEVGTGNIVPAAPGAPLFGVGDHDSVFTNPDGDFISPASGLRLSGASITVVPEPNSLSLLLLVSVFGRRWLQRRGIQAGS